MSEPGVLSHCEQENNSTIEIPEPTSWKRCCGKCGAKILEPEQTLNTTYCFYWQVTPYMPIFVTCLIAYSYISFLILVVPRMPYWWLSLICVIETLATVILFFWSYFGAVCRDPGYLPFNWSQTRKSKYTWDELMSGTAVRKDQLTYVGSVPHPPGCSFSRQSGRYVIRADHICGWIANWVAKRNHKQFILFLFWGAVFAVSLFCWRWAPRSSLKSESEAKYIWELANTVIYALFGILLVLAAGSFMVELCSNSTRVQRYKGEQVARVSWMVAMRSVCGDHNVCCWLCPTSAFPDDIPIEDL